MINVYVDVAGGDNAPEAILQGSVYALEENSELCLTLGGDKAMISSYFASYPSLKDRIKVDHCTEIIDNHDSPAMAIRQKKDSAIVKGMLQLREGDVDGFVSAGSTGAVLLGGMLRLGRITGIERPALAPLMPNGKGHFLLIDCGANIDCKPEMLSQFALMGHVYMKNVHGITSPRIGLANNGAEEEKGNSLTKETFQLLKYSDLNFVGNIEARYITADQADVIVCDGFVGNIILKFMEGVATTLLGMIKRELLSSFRTKIGAFLAKPAFKKIKKTMDSDEIGGAPLLGVQGAVVKAHGSSNAVAFKNAIHQCVVMIERKVVKTISDNVNQ